MDRIFELLLQKYGTSEGVSNSWDTRGRGRKEIQKPQKTNELLQTVKEGSVIRHESGDEFKLTRITNDSLAIDPTKIADKHGNIYIVRSVKDVKQFIDPKYNSTQRSVRIIEAIKVKPDGSWTDKGKEGKTIKFSSDDEIYNAHQINRD
jgi:hypothetical protein